jgi:hypothetical protein
MGYLTGRWMPREKKLLWMRDHLFWDTGDWLEINDLTNHAAAPRYIVAYRESNGTLKLDAQSTWAANADNGHNRRGTPQPEDLLFDAGLAKLCGRNQELRKATENARLALDAASFEAFQKSLKAIRFGTAEPNAFLHVGACPN